VAAVGEDDERVAHRVHAGAGREALRLSVLLDVQPAVRELVPRQVVLDGVAPRRPPVADHADALERRPIVRLPVREQVLEDREQPLLGRVPGLEEVVVEADRVDRGDRHLGVGVGGQQHALGVRVDLGDRREELDARHARHPLVGQEQGDRGAAQLEPTSRVEGGSAAVGSDHAIRRAEPTPQVALDRAEHLRIVVDREDDRLVHARSRSLAPLPRREL